MSNWYQLDSTEVLARLETNPDQGLSGEEARGRLARYGANALVEKPPKSRWLILWEQLTATLVVVLIVASAISAALGDYKDAIAILVIVIVNAFLGVREEYRAEQAMAALKRMAVPKVKVRRDSHLCEISSRDLVPGDIVLLEAGNLVPADGRLFESANLRIQEAALTGESEPVEKDAQLVYETSPALGDRLNMAYMGTTVTYGRALAVITATGMQTELGRIADLLQTVEPEPTPLQGRLDQLGRVLAVVALGIVTVIFLFGMLRGENIHLMFLTAVSLAVAAVPEGLPAVVTIVLALGAQRMLKRRALIRKLPAVETLGSVTVICSDKTGTLTQNRMTVTTLQTADGRTDLSPVRDASLERAEATAIARPTKALLLTAGALCNDAVLEVNDEPRNPYRAIGDPTEGALILAAAREGFVKTDLERIFPRVDEIPFDSERKRMTTVHRLPADWRLVPPGLAATFRDHRSMASATHLAVTKGAMDNLLQVSTHVWAGSHPVPMDEAWRQQILGGNDQLAREGLRVLGVAIRPLETFAGNHGEETLERHLIFVGLVGMIDPPRPEVKEAVATCRVAGLRALMITGDHPLTARHIARQLAMTTNGKLLTGQDLDKLSVEELEDVVESAAVYARVSPEHKLKIVEALQNRGHIVAMTGDGVNDAPALKKADIGVAMGITGTDVSKEASDMVLQDDNFATIVAAVEQGRIIFDNIRKFIKYLLSCNSGELWVMLLGPLMGMPLPLLPIQILWMNLVTDGLPALALGVEPAEKDIMQRGPHPPGEGIFGQHVARDIMWLGILMGLASLGVGYIYWQAGEATWQTMLFTTLTFSQMSLAMTIRSQRASLFSIGLLTNKALLAAVGLSTLLHLGVVYLPFMQAIFETATLSARDLSVTLALSMVVFWGYEAQKWFERERGHNGAVTPSRDPPAR